MSTPRRPLYRRDDVDQTAEPALAGARRLPIEAAVLDVDHEHQDVAVVDQADARPHRRRPLGGGAS
ncbi:hypothetical protein [Streptomyces sp. NRRL S-495]|uniref:hypothetical protein n=1 Tax=Streptomyces sp. NRRL S-495 TaxID=1609133 RepID=UPI0005F91A78|nr:hypothetical protein [Streptomyces sp. NRRL S-495]KJY26432.1 hypothetical protein VR45_37035 [Streptomyces sp. NRRL S-495]